MNVTELARILRITPQELRDKLPQLGFDIGQKAIKVDYKTAQRIIKEWYVLNKKLEYKQEQEAQKQKETIKEKAEIQVPAFITVRDFADLTKLPVSKILAELMKNGIFASLNERIDFETASIIGADLFVNVVPMAESAEAETKEEDKLKDVLGKEKEENLIARAPIIVVMGHVDHGKTRLLDAIRSTNVVAGEAGGITQHVGAYQVVRKNRHITFIDTPGHEAFTAMRSRGDKVADIAILVVAADDSVKPQTVEAHSIIKAANIPFIVAINKIDKPEANIEKTKQDLSTMLNIIPEDWGGKTICAPVSAKDGKGVEELLDMVLLTADLEPENLKANPNAPAIGSVIESHINKGEGPVATILIQNGTLRVGDQLVYDNNIYGKVRALRNYKGENIEEAGPSTPAKIIGLKLAPSVGDILAVGDGEKMKMKNIKGVASHRPSVAKEAGEDENVKKVNVIIKSDVLGSAEAIEESLEKINTGEVKVKIIHRGLGNVSDSDITRAEATGAQILGFNVKTTPQIERLARDKNIAIKKFSIIYDLINDIKAQMQALVAPEIKKVDLGRLKVLAIFRTEHKSQILGGKVLEGKVEADSFITVVRDKEFVAQGKLTKLQSGKQDVKIVEQDQECGIKYEGDPVIEIGDILEFYKEEKVYKKI
ncbi:MAG: translation initiation factor IF-2 [Patescibacteria group bacterium]